MNILAIVFISYQMAGGESSQFYLPLFESNNGGNSFSKSLEPPADIQLPFVRRRHAALLGSPLSNVRPRDFTSIASEYFR